MDNAEPLRSPASLPQPFQLELAQLQSENRTLQDQVARQETELNKIKAQWGGTREERDRLKRKVGAVLAMHFSRHLSGHIVPEIPRPPDSSAVVL